MEEVLKIVLYLLGGLLTALVVFTITTYVIPWIKVKIGENRFDMILNQVQSFMGAAEEHSDSMNGEEKSKWVIDRILEIFPKLNRDYIQALIDGSMRVLEQEGIVNYQPKYHDRGVGY